MNVYLAPTVEIHEEKMQEILNDELFLAAIEFADIASTISKDKFRSKLEINTKNGNYPVTAVDLAIEEKIRAMIKKNYSEHGVIGEEFSDFGKDKEYVWVIDPIDGTAAFTVGKPTYSTLIALLKNGEPIIGVIDQPILEERFIAAKDFGAWLNGHKIHTSSCDTFAMARLNATTPYMFKTEYEKAVFAAVQKQVKVTSFGGDSYAYGLLASGHIDVIIEADLKYYDVASIIPIIEESGGVITDWQGKPITMNFSGQCLATANAQLHKLVLKTIQNTKS